MSSSRVNRYDRMPMASAHRTEAGFLRVEGRISRIGVQEYRDGQGNIRRELRVPEEIFDEASMSSFAMVPLTMQHPPRLLDPTTAKQYTVGTVGENLRRDGNFLVAPIMVTDAATIEAIENGKTALSCGYTCEVEETSGVHPEFGRYDAMQRSVRGNHLSIVDVARGGPEVKIHLDSGDAESVSVPDFGRVDALPYAQSNRGANQMPHVLKIDGFQFEVNDQNAQAVVDRMIAAAKEKHDAAFAEVQAKLDEANAKIAARETADAGMVECDECDGKGKIDGADCEMCGGKGEMRKDALAEKLPASVARRIDRASRKLATERAALLVTARGVLGEGEKLDEMTNDAIKVAVVKSLKPSVSLDGKTSEAVDMAYTVALADQPKKPAAIDQVRTAQAPSIAPKADDNNDPEAAYRRMQERSRSQNVRATKK